MLRKKSFKCSDLRKVRIKAFYNRILLYKHIEARNKETVKTLPNLMLDRVVEGGAVLEALGVIREILGKTFLGSGSSFLKIASFTD